MTKWMGTLSTTEPYNYLGLLKVRQSNKQSETFDFSIIENSNPYNLYGCRVFFCTRFAPYVLIEKEALILNEKDGKIRFTMDDGCMQKVGKQEAYFEIYKNDEWMDSTQNFTYDIQPSIEKALMDGESYIRRLEDLLEQLKEQMGKSQTEVDEWLANNRKEIDKLMEELEQFFEEKQVEFEEWFESVREILESIDPGGLLLSEVIDARKSNHSKKTYSTLGNRLDSMEDSHFTYHYGYSDSVMTILDDLFSANHELMKDGNVTTDSNMHGLVIATIDDTQQDTFYFEKVGDI